MLLFSAFRIFRNAHHVLHATSSVSKTKHTAEEYPYEMRLIIDGLTSPSEVRRLEASLNALPGSYASVDLDTHEALVYMRSELPIASLSEAVREADCLLLTCRLVKSPEQNAM